VLLSHGFHVVCMLLKTKLLIMNDLPSYVSYTFIACVLVTLGFIYYAVSQASPAKKHATTIVMMTIILAWFFIIGGLSYANFFLDFVSTPPKLMLATGFVFLLMVALFSIKKARDFICKMPLTTLTYVHMVRIPVEIVLWWLFLKGLIPVEITFEGMNFDILSGISAPFAALFLLGKKSKSTISAILWNMITAGLLLNVAIRAIAATPYFHVPDGIEVLNIAVFYFPFIFLPLFIVPVALFCHIASIYIMVANTWKN
jgi:hypothetical protein